MDISDSDLGLAGKRVLVVEDEMLVSMLIEDILSDLGCQTVGPVTRVDAALELAGQETIDVAFLDVNIAGQRVFPVAAALAEKGVPFVFVSGYGDQALEAPFEGRPVLKKPFTPDALGIAIRDCLDGSA